MEEFFHFKSFSVRNRDSALKVGTDAVLLGAAMTVLPSDRRILDVGTGTGVIALMAAQRLSEIQAGNFCIEAIDIDSPSALEAAWNFDNSPWKEHLSASCCALQEFQPSKAYDLIFSNPPFYDNSLLNPDERERTARHTLNLSYRDLCSFASEHLTENGRLSLILPSESESTLVRTAASFGLYPFRLLRVRTTASKPPRRLVAGFSRHRSDIVEDELTLQEGPSRTPAWTCLCEKFYLQESRI